MHGMEYKYTVQKHCCCIFYFPANATSTCQNDPELDCKLADDAHSICAEHTLAATKYCRKYCGYCTGKCKRLFAIAFSNKLTYFWGMPVNLFN
ncbi:hypothetical protein DPMN_157101 [Dreissena polymorpha]|uniref:ShKT domain-containing protein n=1 Tax=Dreissena polymorpha TaxID=45954 RepID=A0A9D4ILY7_DREPO|nr:hypothetical protein DPMN_157101 [Dreissena polymorpha]